MRGERTVDTAQVLVTLGGIVLIAFILWFFLGAREANPPPE
jgi:plastocyanin domain-containing protein